jgi:hypothetical protein
MTVHAKCVTLWCVSGLGSPLCLRSRNLLEFEDCFRKTGDASICRPWGDIVVSKVEGEPLYPWRRSELAAVTAYRERLLADMRALEDRLRRLEAARDEALGLLSEEG